MKKIFIRILFVLIGLSFVAILSAQDEDIGNDPISQHKLNFAVPDLPAFKALGTEPSNILRPSTPEAFSLVISEFQSDNNFTLPQNFAAEFAPMILARGDKITLSEYQEKSVFYNTRVSIGTARDTLNEYDLAVGLKITLIDKGDLKNDNAFLELIVDELENANKAKDTIRSDLMDELDITYEEYANNQKNNEKIVNERYDKYTHLRENPDKAIKAMIEEYKKKNWNKQKLDLAIASVGHTTDSAGSNFSFNSLDIWLSYAAPIINKYSKDEISVNKDLEDYHAGQILLGGHMRSYEEPEDRKTYFNFSLNSRLYLGSNRLKGFGEFQYNFRQYNELNYLLLTLGGEINPVDGIWLEFYAGLERNSTLNINSSTARFNLRFTIPENFKLF